MPKSLRSVRQPKVALVTGAAGFAGRHLLATLRAETSWELVGLTRVIGEYERSAPAKFLRADVLLDNLGQILYEIQPDYIFHLAAVTPPASDAEILTVNVHGTMRLLEAVGEQCPRAAVLIVGSDAQYGLLEPDNIPTDERVPQRPLGVYGRSKVLQEVVARGYQRMRALRVVCVRPFNYIGPGQSEHFVVSALARQIALAEVGLGASDIEIGSMDAARDFTDVRDVSRAFLLSVLCGRSGEVFNIGSGKSYRIEELAALFSSMARVPVRIKSVPNRVRTDDIPLTQCNAARIRRRTGWMPRIPLQETLEAALQDWRGRISGGLTHP